MTYVVFLSNSPSPFNVDTDAPLLQQWLKHCRSRSRWGAPKPFEITEADGKLIGVFAHDAIIAIIEGATAPTGGQNARH